MSPAFAGLNLGYVGVCRWQRLSTTTTFTSSSVQHAEAGSPYQAYVLTLWTLYLNCGNACLQNLLQASLHTVQKQQLMRDALGTAQSTFQLATPVLRWCETSDRHWLEALAELEKYGSDSDTMLSKVLFGESQVPTNLASHKSLAGSSGNMLNEMGVKGMRVFQIYLSKKHEPTPCKGDSIEPLAPMVADYHLKESMLSEDKGA
eukprot:scaffold21789_cov22-Tisochrysis_lutea.AAC.1